MRCSERGDDVARRSTIEAEGLEHPATTAWFQLRPDNGQPSKIRTLCRNKKSAVYRLYGVGLEGSAVIAKRGSQSSLTLERTIYEEILPHLPVTTLHCYGFVADEREDRKDGNTCCWLFLEDAGGRWYEPHKKEHSTLAARWLGLMHTSAARVAAASSLPARDPGYYLAELRSGREAILFNLSNPVLTEEERKMLMVVVAQCDFVESHWDDLEQFCNGLPHTLVHGDFVRKNVRLRSSEAGMALLPLDWETAGWGTPAPDIFSVEDLPTYHAVVREDWPHLDLQDVKQLLRYGRLLRLLLAINWDSRCLRYPWVEESIENMTSYQTWMTDCIHALGWGSL
jgi:hypothetical protein